MIKWLKCSKTKSSTRLFYFQHDWVIEVLKNKFIHPSVLLPTWLSDCSVKKQIHPPVCSTSNMIEWLVLKTNSPTVCSTSNMIEWFQHDWVIVKKQIHPPVCSTSNMIEWLKCYKNKFIHPSVLLPTWLSDWGVIKTNSSTRLFYFQHDWVIEVLKNKFIHPSVLLPTWLSDWGVIKTNSPTVCSTSNMIEWLKC